MADALFDGSSIFARAFFATMSTPGRSPQEAVRAALCSVLSLLNPASQKLDERVDRTLFAWDGPNRRNKGRDPKPPHYHEARELFREYLTVLLNPAHACLEASEADDVVATAAAQSDADEVFVISGDKDLQQLAGPHVHYYCLNAKIVLSLRHICGRWNVKQPSQAAIALAILGDPVDAVPGIKGWGPKRVKKLFERVTPEMSLEDALLVVEAQIPAALHEAFYHDLDLVLLNRELPGVPPAAPIQLAPLAVAEELQLPSFMEFYQPVFRQYQPTTRVDADGDAEDTGDY